MESKIIVHKTEKYTYYLGQILNNKKIVSEKFEIWSEKVKLNISHIKIICINCNNERTVQLGKLRENKPCRKCSVGKSINSYKEVSSDFYNKFKNSAKIRGLYFDITPKDIYDLWIKQNKKCNFSGIELYFTKNRIRKHNKNLKETSYFWGNASIDRIDSLKGYTLDNIQLLEKNVNIMKLNHSDSYFLNMCKLITEFQEVKNGDALRNIVKNK